MCGFYQRHQQLRYRGLTDEHLAAFKKHGTERILIAYDQDEAGDKAADKLAVQLIAAGIECLRCVSPRPGRQQHGLKTPACPAQFRAAVAPGRMDRAASNSIPPAPASDKYAPPLASAGEVDPLAAGWRL